MLEAKGGYFDENDVAKREDTLVYILIGIDENAVISIMDEVLTALNLNSILVEKRSAASIFYTGGAVGTKTS